VSGVSTRRGAKPTPSTSVASRTTRRVADALDVGSSLTPRREADALDASGVRRAALMVG
jgi:hypothetical protein